VTEPKRGILVIDDEHDTRESLRIILEAAGYLETANFAGAHATLVKPVDPDELLAVLRNSPADGGQ
jgi:DNA-binding response OmpR family regulator